MRQAKKQEIENYVLKKKPLRHITNEEFSKERY